MRQERVVKHLAGGKPDVGQNEKYDDPNPVAESGQAGERGSQCAEDGKNEEVPFFPSSRIGDGSEHQRQTRRKKHGERGRVSPDRGRQIPSLPPGDFPEENGKHGRHERGGEGGIGPVVQAPGLNGFAIWIGLHHVAGFA